MNWLLIFVPIAVLLHFLTPEQGSWVFLAAAIAIVPLAAWLGWATEQIAARAGEGVGGFLNATFGNAAELIIAAAALRAGLYQVVAASLVGSIIGNVLLVLGAAMLAGGLGRSSQSFNVTAARTQSTMLTLAAIAFILPAAYSQVAGAGSAEAIAGISVWFALILIAAYGAYLYYSLVTHRELFQGNELAEGEAHHSSSCSLRRAGLVLAAATAGIALISEILVSAIEPATEQLHLSDWFVGIFVVAILGNAAEHSTAIVAARQNRMDLALSIAIGSSVQVALFVAPLLVFLSYVMGPSPMNLVFPGPLVLIVVLAVWITGQVVGDGRSDWLRGMQLLVVYLIMAIVFLFGSGVSGV